MKIAVIGAGIIGTLTAYEFARMGHFVKVYDREDGVALKCSKANGGQISVCNAQTWNTWANVGKGLKWMFQKDAPLLIRPTLELNKLKWLAGFLRHTLNGSHIENTIKTIELGQLSSYFYDRIIEREGLSFDQSKCGLLHVYSESKSLDVAMGHQALFEDHGVEWRYVPREEIMSLDPALKTFKNLKGGIITTSDWTGDAHQFCEALRKICEEKFGARFYFNTEVTKIRNRAIESRDFTFAKYGVPQLEAGFDLIVVCNGHEIAKFAKELGDSMNVYPVKGYSITVDDVGDSAPFISLLDDDKKIVSSRLGNRLRIAGTAELTGADDSINQERIDPLVKWCNENFPSVDTSNYAPWACLRPMNSNMMPIIKQSKSMPGVWYHGGHGHLGWTLGAATTAKLVAQVDFP